MVELPIGHKRQDKQVAQESQDYEPLGRRGACSFVYNDCFYLYGGSLEGAQSFRQSPPVNVDILDLQTGQWSSADTKVLHSLPNSISGSCCTVLNHNLYVFGGWLAGRRNADVHELNLKTLTWRKLLGMNPESGPICKDKAGMFSYGDHMVGLFGGYGGASDFQSYGLVESRTASYDWDPNTFFAMYDPLCWTNELHLFHVEKLEWIVPVTTGPPPPPCAAFSLTRVDPYRVVVFGGKQLNQRVNEVHILDLDSWHWSGVNLPSRPDEAWPVGRSFHTACSLLDPTIVAPPHAPSGNAHTWLPCHAPDLSPSEPTLDVYPKVLVLWGMDNNADAISDAWILDVSSLTWSLVRLPEGAETKRAWHTAAAHYPSPCEAVVVVCGGTSGNIFNTPEHQLCHISRTEAFCCGVRSLCDVLIDLITHDDQLMSQLDRLPHHIQKQLQEHKAIKRHFKASRLRL